MAKAEIVLSPQKERLEELEAQIESAVVHAYVTAGTALKAIRDEKVHKAAGFDTFDDYCRVRWKMVRRQADYLITASSVYGILEENNCSHLPGNEAVSRELTPLLPAPPILKKAWKEAVKTAPTEDDEPIVTAKHVKAIVKKYRMLDEPEAFPGKGYRVLYADPPWKYNDELIEGYGAADHHYPQMSIMELCDMKDANKTPVSEIMLADSVLFMWVTSPLLEVCFEVIRAWGFEYKTSFVWDKVKHNYGHYNSVRHELLLICTQGSCTPDSSTLRDSVVTLERSGKHSEKPELFREIIDEMYPPPKGKKNNRVEMFARAQLPKWWDGYGNELPA